MRSCGPCSRAWSTAYDALSLGRREVKKVHDGLQLLLAQVVPEPAAQGKDPEPAKPPPADQRDSAVVGPAAGARPSCRYGPRSVSFLVQSATTAWAGSARPETRPEPEACALAQRIRQGIQSILTGYGMSLQRLERALEQYGLEPIAALGELFDPEQMEALEVVHDPERARARWPTRFAAAISGMARCFASPR